MWIIRSSPTDLLLFLFRSQLFSPQFVDWQVSIELCVSSTVWKLIIRLSYNSVHISEGFICQNSRLSDLLVQ